MTLSGKTLFYFGLYAIVSGILFIIVPEFIISINKLPELPRGWSSVVGLLALVIGSYDLFIGRNNIQPLIRFSVYVRFGFFVGTILLWTSAQMPLTIIGFGIIDALGAIITILALKKEAVVLP